MKKLFTIALEDELSQDVEVPSAEVEAAVAAYTEEPGAVAAPAPDEPTPEEQAVLAEVSDQPEAVIAEAEELAEQVAEVEEDIDPIERAAYSLESIADILQANNYRLTPQASQLLQVSLEHIYEDLQLHTPGMESLSVATGRDAQGRAQVTLEDIGRQAADLWGYILAALKRAAEWIQEYLSRVLTAEGRMKARAEKVLEEASKLSKQPYQNRVGNAHMAVSLAVDKTLPNNLAKELTLLGGLVEDVVSSRTFHGLQRATAMLESMIAEGATSEIFKTSEKFQELLVELTGKKLHPATQRAYDYGVPQAGEGVDVVASDVLVGNVIVWAHLPRTYEQLNEFRTGTATAQVDVKETAKLPTLSKAAIEAVTKEVLRFLKLNASAKQLNESLSRYTEALSRLIAKIKIIEQSAAASGSGEVTPKEYFREMRATLQTAARLAKGVHQPVLQAGYRANLSALNYAEASLRAYEAPEVKPT